MELDGRVSVFTPETQTVHVLSESASAVWRQLEESVDLEAVAREIAHQFAVPVDQVRADVVAVLDTLVEAHLVVVGGGAAA